MKNKLILLLVLSCLVLSLASANSYHASMHVYPTGSISAYEDALVFGTISTSLSNVYYTSLRIEVRDQNTNTLIYSQVPDYLPFSGSVNLLEDGIFFTKLSLGPGRYTIRLNSGDLILAMRSVEVLDFSKTTNLKILDYSISQNKINVYFSINNSGSSLRHYTVYFTNKDLTSQFAFNVNVNANEVAYFNREFELFDFEFNRFVIIAQAREVLGSALSSSNADILVVYNTGLSRTSQRISITNVSVPPQLYTGEIFHGTAYVKNYGNEEVSYVFEYVANNKVFKSGHVSYVHPGHTNEEKFFLEIPEFNTLKLTVRVITPAYSIERTNDYMLATRTKHYSLVLSEYTDNVFAGNPVNFNATIANLGNQNDSYFIKVLGWHEYSLDKETLSLMPNYLGNFAISLNTSPDMQIGIYPVTINICNTEGVCLNKTFSLTLLKTEKEQNLVIYDINQSRQVFSENKFISYNLSLTNLGVSEKNYEISFVPELSEPLQFSILSKETKEVFFGLTPVEKINQTVTMYLSAENITIFTEKLELVYQEKPSGMLTGMFVFVGKGYTPGLILLGLVGISVLIYFVYNYVGKRVWLEKVDKFNYQNSRGYK